MEFTVFTDNNALVRLKTTRLGAVEQRWAAQLANFKYIIKYRLATQNRNADALSRLPEQETKPLLDSNQVIVERDETWEERQARDPDLSQVCQWKRQQLPRPEVSSPTAFI